MLDYRKKRASCSFENHYAHDCTTMLYYDRPLTHRASPSSYLVMAAFRNAVRHEDTPRVLPALLPFAFLFLLPARPFSISLALLLLFLSPSLFFHGSSAGLSFFFSLSHARSRIHYAFPPSSTLGSTRRLQTGVGSRELFVASARKERFRPSHFYDATIPSPPYGTRHYYECRLAISLCLFSMRTRT